MSLGANKYLNTKHVPTVTAELHWQRLNTLPRHHDICIRSKTILLLLSMKINRNIIDKIVLASAGLGRNYVIALVSSVSTNFRLKCIFRMLRSMQIHWTISHCGEIWSCSCNCRSNFDSVHQVPTVAGWQFVAKVCSRLLNMTVVAGIETRTSESQVQFLKLSSTGCTSEQESVL